jgi:ketosteroid isomerase-like protein
MNQESEATKLMNLSREWSKSAGTDDIEKTLSYWSADAICMFPGQPVIKGTNQIRQMLIGTTQIPGFEISWEPKEAIISQSGELGYVITLNYFKALDPLGKTATMFNKGVEIWKKQPDEQWKCVVDIYNDDPSLKAIR